MKVLRSSGRPRLAKMKNQDGIVVSNRSEVTAIVEDFYKHLYSSGNQKENQDQRRKIKNVGSEEVLEIDNGELLAALHKMKNRKNTGEDQITSEMIKMGNEILLDKVRVLLNKCITEERIEFRTNGKML